MDLTYANHTVRIVQNPSDIIVRFTEPTTHRNYETTFTERSFIEYQVLGGLEFVSSLLIKALQEPTRKSPAIEDFKASSKEIAFKLSYSPDTHCKMTALEFVIPAIKKDSANADLEALTRQVQALMKLTETLKSTITESKSGFSKAVEDNRIAFNKALDDKTTMLTRAFEDKTALLKVELDMQKAKSAGYIVIPGIRFVIDENTPELNIGLNLSQNPLLCSQHYHNPEATYYNVNHATHQGGTQCDQYKFSFQGDYSGDRCWLGDISNLKYLKKCKKLTISNGWNIKNFSPISEMTELEELNILTNEQTKINQTTSFDISFVKTLKKLNTVSFYGYISLKDISPLASCPALTSVDIRQTGVGNANCLPSSVKIIK